MLIYNYTINERTNKGHYKTFFLKKGVIDMLNEEICELRDKLNKSIEDGEDYSIIYQLSIELDELIAKFYRENDGQ